MTGAYVLLITLLSDLAMTAALKGCFLKCVLGADASSTE